MITKEKFAHRRFFFRDHAPVGHSVDARAIAALVDPDAVDLQSTGFVLDPAGRVVVSVYSSGATGRLVPEDVISLARYLREHPPA